MIDEGRKHCMVGRLVGTSPDGCTDCLVARIAMASYERLLGNETLTDEMFFDARELRLCVVFEAEDAVSNVSVIETFATLDEVPVEYLPLRPMIAFTEDL
jgi:hypothetical protein